MLHAGKLSCDFTVVILTTNQMNHPSCAPLFVFFKFEEEETAYNEHRQIASKRY